MDKKIKIKISENAYSKLLAMLSQENDYTHLRFTYKDGCCGSSKVDISLDNLRSEDITDNIESLPVVYNAEILEKIREITLVYRNSSFMINTILYNIKKKDCSSCNSANSTCGNGCCKSH